MSISIGSAVVATVICFIQASVYGSIRGPEAFIASMVPVSICSVISLIIAIAVPPKSRRGLVGLSLLCLLPALIIVVVVVSEDIAFRINGPSDRFRDHLGGAIPASVSGLAFVPFEERPTEPALMLRFKIAPSDLDQLLLNDGFTRVQQGKLRNLDDTFNNPFYLRIGDADELYQRTDALSEIGTLRVNKEHTEVVFRSETYLLGQRTTAMSTTKPLSSNANSTLPAQQ